MLPFQNHTASYRELSGEISLATLDILRNRILRNVLNARVRIEGPIFERLAASDYAAFDGLVRDTLSLRHG